MRAMTSVLDTAPHPERAKPGLARTFARSGAATFVNLGLSIAVIMAAFATPAAASTYGPVLERAGATASAEPTLPATSAGDQAHWLVQAVQHLPVSSAAIAAHFDNKFLAQVPTAEVNAVLAEIGPFHLVSISVAQPAAIDFVVATSGTTGSSDFTVDLTVDTQGLISGLLLKPLVVGASSWSAVDSDVRSAAPVVHLLVARVSDGRCAPAHTIEASAPEPLGSAFKLYVLDALANAISSGRARWDEKLTITDSIKSLPSGELQNDPPGTQVTVLQAATDMISISDNTAADLLARLVGRSNIEAATRSAGMTKPALDAPFLTTRELFTLKLDSWPHLANRYLALTAAQKTTFLTTTVDRIPQKQLIAAVRSSPPWTNPRDINTLEWFASADDICRVYASLLAASQRPGLGNIAKVLSVNNGSLGLAANQWRSVWFKGGSEPGVLTLNYLATTRDGRTYVVSFLGENPKAPIQQTRAETAVLSAIRGAFELVAKTA
jgi:hypothetical protein